MPKASSFKAKASLTLRRQLFNSTDDSSDLLLAITERHANCDLPLLASARFNVSPKATASELLCTLRFDLQISNDTPLVLMAGGDLLPHSVLVANVVRDKQNGGRYLVYMKDLNRTQEVLQGAGRLPLGIGWVDSDEKMDCVCGAGGPWLPQMLALPAGTSVVAARKADVEKKIQEEMNNQETELAQEERLKFFDSIREGKGMKLMTTSKPNPKDGDRLRSGLDDNARPRVGCGGAGGGAVSNGEDHKPAQEDDATSRTGPMTPLHTLRYPKVVFPVEPIPANHMESIAQLPKPRYPKMVSLTGPPREPLSMLEPADRYYLPLINSSIHHSERLPKLVSTVAVLSTVTSKRLSPKSIRAGTGPCKPKLQSHVIKTTETVLARKRAKGAEKPSGTPPVPMARSEHRALQPRPQHTQHTQCNHPRFATVPQTPSHTQIISESNPNRKAPAQHHCRDQVPPPKTLTTTNISSAPTTGDIDMRNWAPSAEDMEGNQSPYRAILNEKLKALKERTQELIELINPPERGTSERNLDSSLADLVGENSAGRSPRRMVFTNMRSSLSMPVVEVVPEALRKGLSEKAIVATSGDAIAAEQSPAGRGTAGIDNVPGPVGSIAPGAPTKPRGLARSGTFGTKNSNLVLPHNGRLVTAAYKPATTVAKKVHAQHTVALARPFVVPPKKENFSLLVRNTAPGQSDRRSRKLTEAKDTRHASELAAFVMPRDSNSPPEVHPESEPSVKTEDKHACELTTFAMPRSTDNAHFEISHLNANISASVRGVQESSAQNSMRHGRHHSRLPILHHCRGSSQKGSEFAASGWRMPQQSTTSILGHRRHHAQPPIVQQTARRLVGEIEPSNLQNTSIHPQVSPAYTITSVDHSTGTSHVPLLLETASFGRHAAGPLEKAPNQKGSVHQRVHSVTSVVPQGSMVGTAASQGRIRDALTVTGLGHHRRQCSQIPLSKKPNTLKLSRAPHVRQPCFTAGTKIPTSTSAANITLEAGSEFSGKFAGARHYHMRSSTVAYMNGLHPVPTQTTSTQIAKKTPKQQPALTSTARRASCAFNSYA